MLPQFAPQLANGVVSGGLVSALDERYLFEGCKVLEIGEFVEEHLWGHCACEGGHNVCYLVYEFVIGELQLAILAPAIMLFQDVFLHPF
jgi:hypothetical protein